MVRLLRGGKVPVERQATVVEMIGRRGTAADLTYLLGRVVEPEGFSPELRQSALDALAEAGRNRRLRPEGDVSAVVALANDSAVDLGLRVSAARLAGLWEVAGALDPLSKLAAASATPAALRVTAIEALANLGEPARSRLESLDHAEQPRAVRVLAVAALTRFDVAAAAVRAASLIASATDTDDLTPLVGAFVNRQGGAEILARAMESQPPGVDPARLALRALYALGRADASLVTTLSTAAGIDSEVRSLTDAEMTALSAEILATGDAARGERVFRRKDLNCLGCHAVAGVGGAIGPDMGSLGLTSPPDYLVRSILTPDEAIKEQYATLVLQTSDGQIFHGIVADRDDQRVVLKEATGATRSIPTAEIEEQQAGGSLMPKGLSNLMTHAELVDLVRYLSELGKAGPYALPAATPAAIRRWRVFRDVPRDFQTSWPESIQVYQQLLNASPEQWVSAYALHNGALPLADLTATAGGPVVYLMGEVDVAEPGDLVLRVEQGAGVRLWVNSRPTELDGETARVNLAKGVQRLIVRVDTTERGVPEVRLTVETPEGSSARFTPVGGP